MPDTRIQDVFSEKGLHVSRETVEKLVIYERLLLKWQKAINLVGSSTLDDLALRHFYDSAQILKYIENTQVRLADLGTGAGFPGLVLAMLGVREAHLVESDVRKATFLREVSRETETPVTIHDRRAEECIIPGIDILTARAFAPLKDILVHTNRLLTAGHPTYCIFQKGLNYQEEINEAIRKWIFDYEVFPSETDDSGKIIRLRNIVKK